MKLSEKQRVFTKNIGLLIIYAFDELCIELTFGEAYRTREQQLLYVQSGKSQTMNSNHLRRLAVDFNFFIDGNLSSPYFNMKVALGRKVDFYTKVVGKQRPEDLLKK